VDDSDESSPGSYKERLKEYALSARDTLVSLANSTIRLLNDTSRDYRHIASQLQYERKDRAKTVLERPKPPSAVYLPPDLSRAITPGTTKVTSTSFITPSFLRLFYSNI